MLWPSKLPDLNPTEHPWQILDRHVRKHHYHHQNTKGIPLEKMVFILPVAFHRLKRITVKLLKLIKAFLAACGGTHLTETPDVGFSFNSPVCIIIVIWVERVVSIFLYESEKFSSVQSQRS